MSDQAAIGLLLSQTEERRAELEAACAGGFARLLSAGDAAAVRARLASERVDLLVIDLEGFDPLLDREALAGLVAARAGAPAFVLCPFANARWLPLLMAAGPIGYAITPLAPAEVPVALAACLAGRAPAAPGLSPQLAALRALVRAALAPEQDPATLGERLCAAPGAWPGVVHAGLFEREPGGELRLGAQRGEPALDLARVLGRGERLLGSPLRAVFPGLVAAAADAVVLLDVVAKAGDPSMAAALRAHGVDCVLALPVPGSSAGEPRGALCLSFKAAPPFTHEEFALLLELAELAGIGLRLADLQGERAGMLARIAQLSTIDALTGVANRRHGESLLEAEVKRARRYGLPLAVIAFDIDRFSEVNARFGHPVGDLALRAVAEATQKMLRGSDIPGACRRRGIHRHRAARERCRWPEGGREAARRDCRYRHPRRRRRHCQPGRGGAGRTGERRLACPYGSTPPGTRQAGGSQRRRTGTAIAYVARRMGRCRG
nr:GGDEF domain-containing protein [Massilia sp. Se16.2.3]